LYNLSVAFRSTLSIALIAALPLAAHHVQSERFNTKKPVTLRGFVTQVEWINPHAWLHMDVKDANGQVTSWMVEICAPNALRRQAVAKDSFQPGETSVDVWLAKDGSRLADGRYGGILALPDGKKVTLPFWSASGKALLFTPPATK
jgi:hypothetical protein